MAVKQHPYIRFRAGQLTDGFNDRTKDPRITATDYSSTMSMIARRDLSRYWALVGEELATFSLTEHEALALCDVVKVVPVLDASTIRLFWAMVERTLQKHDIAGKWSVSERTLISKLKALSPGQAYALVDALERYWVVCDNVATPRAALQAVGLLH